MSENREPSMEEIVASIRRIIAQGGGPAGSTAPAEEGQTASAEGSASDAATAEDPALAAAVAGTPGDEAVAEPDDSPVADAFTDTPLVPESTPDDDSFGTIDQDFAQPEHPASPEPAVELSAETEHDMTQASDDMAETQPFPASPDSEGSFGDITPTDEEGQPAYSDETDTSGSDTVSAARLQSETSDEPPLITGAAADSTRAAFGQLTETFSTKRDSRTVEEIVEALLRPQIKTWLDENLASIVHARVQAEVERIARTGGR